jgi:hypothetical protein
MFDTCFGKVYMHVPQLYGQTTWQFHLYCSIYQNPIVQAGQRYGFNLYVHLVLEHGTNRGQNQLMTKYLGSPV